LSGLPYHRSGINHRRVEADKAITAGEVRRILEWLEERDPAAYTEGPRMAAHWRDYVLVYTLSVTGLRASEVAAIRRRDLFLKGPRPYLVVRRGKWRRDGEPDCVYLSRALAVALADYATRYGPEEEEDFLFRTSSGRGISRREVREAVKRAVAALGLNPRYSAHTLRHYAITSWASAPGAHPYAVAKLARLRSMDTVLRYFHPSPDAVSALAEAGEVRGRKK